MFAYLYVKCLSLFVSIYLADSYTITFEQSLTPAAGRFDCV